MRIQLALNVRDLDDDDVRAASERLKPAGMEQLAEDDTTCCYATQNQVWSQGPQGMRREGYRVVSDSPTFGGAPPEGTTAE